MEVILQSIDLNTNKIVFSTEGAREHQTANLLAKDYPAFCDSISAALGGAPSNGTDLFYYDDEGDKIFVGSESELAEALRQLETSPEPADLPLSKKNPAANKPDPEKARQAKRQKLSKREEALGHRIQVLEKKIEQLQGRKGELEKLRTSVRQQLETLEPSKEGEAPEASEVPEAPRQQVPNQQQLLRRHEQLVKQREKVLFQLGNSNNPRRRAHLENRSRLLTEQIDGVERSLLNRFGYSFHSQ